MEHATDWAVAIGPERIILTDGLQPYVFRTAAGRLIVQAQLSFPPGYQPLAANQFPGIIATVVSDDGGESWQRWLPTPEQGEGPLTEGTGTLLRDGTVMLINWVATRSVHDAPWTGARWESRDNYATVDGPLPFTIDIPQAKAGFDDGGHPYHAITFHRTLLELPGGDLLAPAYCWFEGDDTPCPYQPRMCKFRTVLLRSSDRGQHWRYIATIAVDPNVGEEGFDEPVMVRLSHGPAAGRLLCLLRTGCDDCALYQTHSDDEGATWSLPRELPMHGVDPDLIELQDGTLICSAGRRINAGHEEARGFFLYVSTDQGTTWRVLAAVPPTESYALTAAGARPERPDGLLSEGDHFSTEYSAVIELQPDTLLWIYDVGRWGHTVRYIASREIHLSHNTRTS